MRGYSKCPITFDKWIYQVSTTCQAQGRKENQDPKPGLAEEQCTHVHTTHNPSHQCHPAPTILLNGQIWHWIEGDKNLNGTYCTSPKLKFSFVFGHL